MYFHPQILPLQVHARRLGSGPVVVCLHSSGSSSAQWHELGADLAHDHHVIVPDLLGHGRSPAAPAPDDSLAQDAAQVAALVAGHDSVHLVGHSYGAAVALRVALAQPARVRSLALYEPVMFGALRDHTEDESLWHEVVQAGRTFALRTRQRQVLVAGRGFVDYWSGQGRWSALGPERQLGVARRMTTIAGHFEALFAWSPGAQLRSIEQPVLLMRGERTRRVAARVASRLAAALPHVTSVVVPGAGHLGPITRAAAVNAQITRFVRDAVDAPSYFALAA